MTATGLTHRDAGLVEDAVVAVESAERPVAEADFEALIDPALRRHVAAALTGAGRTLIAVGDGDYRCWLSGYDDSIADRLAAEGIGVLAPVDAAVLTLVILHAVVIPSARGEIERGDWVAEDLPAPTVETLARNRSSSLGTQAIKASLRRLRAAGVLRPGHRALIVPGPQFLRLTAARDAAIWDGLITAAAPDSGLAKAIRLRRGTPHAR